MPLTSRQLLHNALLQCFHQATTDQKRSSGKRGKPAWADPLIYSFLYVYGVYQIGEV